LIITVPFKLVLYLQNMIKRTTRSFNPECHVYVKRIESAAWCRVGVDLPGGIRHDAHTSRLVGSTAIFLMRVERY
jgi:hypothetical protein